MLSTPALGQLATSALEHGRVATAGHLTNHLRQRATSAGWPSHVVGGMRVVHQDGKFQVELADHVHEKAMDLEYGTQQTPPNAAIRQFTNRMHDYADEFFVASVASVAGAWL